MFLGLLVLESTSPVPALGAVGDLLQSEAQLVGQTKKL